jgi:hypothetical protein
MFLADEGIGGTFTSGAAIASYGPDTLDFFARGQNNQLYERSVVNGAWTGWLSMGGAITSDPAAVGLSSASIFVAARQSNNDFYYKESIGRMWDRTSSGWAPTHGILTSSPTLVNTQDGKAWLFGRGNDNGLWYQVYNGSTWSAWTPLGGVLASDPSATSISTGGIHVFYLSTSGTLEYRWYSPSSGWSGATHVDNTTFSNAPVVTSSKNLRLDVFVRAANGSLQYRKWYGQWASTWGNVGYTATSNPSFTSWGTGRLDAVFRGSANYVRYAVYGG